MTTLNSQKATACVAFTVLLILLAACAGAQPSGELQSNIPKQKIRASNLCIDLRFNLEYLDDINQGFAAYDAIENILERMGYHVSTDSCDATVIVDLAGEPRGQDYDGKGKCYTGARVWGFVAIDSSDGDVRINVAGNRYPPSSTDACPKRSEAPYSEVWPGVILDGLTRLFGQEVGVHGLASNDVEVRLAALSILGSYGDETVIAPLLAILGDTTESDRLRTRAAYALKMLASDASAGVLVSVLQNHKESSSLRAAAAAALGGLDDPDSIEVLLFALEDATSEVRRAALGAVAQRGDARSVEPVMKAVLGSGNFGLYDFDVAIGIRDSARSSVYVEPLVEALDDPDPRLRRNAVQALALIGGARAAEGLTTAISDEDIQVSGTAIMALSQGIADVRSVQALIEVLKTNLLTSDQLVLTGLPAAKALGNIGDPSAVVALEEALASAEDDSLRKQAAEALGQIADPSSIDTLIGALLNDGSRSVRVAAAQALGEIGDQRSTDALTVAYESGEMRLKIVAASSLVFLGDNRGVGFLLHYLEKCDEKIVRDDGAIEGPDLVACKHAAVALGKLGLDEAVPALIDLVRYWDLRDAVLEALATIGSPEALSFLSDYVQTDSEPRNRANAALFLGRTGDSTAIEPLIEALRDKHQVRRAAADALRSITGEDFGQNAASWEEWFRSQR